MLSLENSNNHQKITKAEKAPLKSIYMFVGNRDMFLHIRAHNKHVVGGVHLLGLMYV